MQKRCPATRLWWRRNRRCFTFIILIGVVSPLCEADAVMLEVTEISACWKTREITATSGGKSAVWATQHPVAGKVKWSAKARAGRNLCRLVDSKAGLWDIDSAELPTQSEDVHTDTGEGIW